MLQGWRNFFAVASRTQGIIHHFVEVTLYRESSVASNAIATFVTLMLLSPQYLPTLPPVLYSHLKQLQEKYVDSIVIIVTFLNLLFAFIFICLSCRLCCIPCVCMQDGSGDFLVVLDFHRKQSRFMAPGQVVVPLWPQCSDMVWIYIWRREDSLSG